MTRPPHHIHQQTSSRGDVRGRFAVTRLAARWGMRESSPRNVAFMPSADQQFHRAESLYINFGFWVVICAYTWAVLTIWLPRHFLMQLTAFGIAAVLYPFIFQGLLLVAGGVRRLLALLGIGKTVERGTLMGRILIAMLTVASCALIFAAPQFRVPSLLWLGMLAANVSAYIIEMPFALIQSDSDGH